MNDSWKRRKGENVLPRVELLKIIFTCNAIHNKLLHWSLPRYLLFTSLHEDSNGISHFSGISCSGAASFPGLIPKLDPCKPAHSQQNLCQLLLFLLCLILFWWPDPLLPASQMKHGGRCALRNLILPVT